MTATLGRLSCFLCNMLLLWILFQFYIYYTGEGKTAVVALAKAAVQVCDGAAWLDACNLLALVADGDLLVKVDKVVVEADGEAAVVALLYVDDIAVNACNDGLALLNLVGRGCEPIDADPPGR